MTSYASPPAAHATTDPSQQRATATVGSPRRSSWSHAISTGGECGHGRRRVRPPSKNEVLKDRAVEGEEEGVAAAAGAGAERGGALDDVFPTFRSVRAPRRVH